MNNEPKYIWQDDAACAFWPSSMFDLIRADDPIARDFEGTRNQIEEEIRLLNIANFEKAAEICSVCPVIDQCKAEATPDDREYVFRAGLVPTSFTSVKRGRPSRISEDSTCLRGHVGSYQKNSRGEWQCRECNRSYKKNKTSRKNGTETRCVRGHENQWKYRANGSRWCNECNRLRNKSRADAVGQDKPCPKGHVGERVLYGGRVRCRICYNDKRRAQRAKQATGK